MNRGILVILSVISFSVISFLLFNIVSVSAYKEPNVIVTMQDSPQLPPQKCQIYTPRGILNDLDCDGVYDEADNCPNTANSMQEDSNRNGIGDACDIIIEEVKIEPTTILKAGEFYKLTVKLLNNRNNEIKNVNVRVKSQKLNYNEKVTLNIIPMREAADVEFLLKVPRCTTEGYYSLEILADLIENKNSFVQRTNQNIQVVKGGLCQEPETVMENTIIETFYEAEAYPDSSALIPIKITNLNKNAETYNLSLYDISVIGTYRIDPDKIVSIPSGHDTLLNLYIRTEKFAPAGEVTLSLIVKGRDGEEVIPIKFLVRKNIGESSSVVWKRSIEITIVLIILILLIIGIIIAYKKINEQPPEKDEKKRSESKAKMKNEKIVKTNKKRREKK